MPLSTQNLSSSLSGGYLNFKLHQMMAGAAATTANTTISTTDDNANAEATITDIITTWTQPPTPQ
jgi:hypothetical protein